MTNLRNTKRALFSSTIALLVCFAMLLGTTYAWFTDSVTSSGNIIQSGTLKVTMEWADGKNDPAAANWEDASKVAIFNYDKWEPGYVEVRHIKIENIGTLALKYKIAIIANGEVSDLANVIDVYYVDPAVQVADRTVLTENAKLGTLTEVLGKLNETASGNLSAGEKHTITLALKMQETADNNYKGKSLGTSFSVQLVATQYTEEEDSFDDQYDVDASLDFYPVSNFAELKTALANKAENILLTNNIVVEEGVTVGYNATINGAGYTVSRANGYTGTVMTVGVDSTLTLADITVDGGAVWTGEIDPVLQRGTVNNAVTATGNLVATAGNGSIVLNEGTIIQNNDGANAISLSTRGGGSLTVNGAEIINNCSAAGAIWGGDDITINSGKINGNHATTIGGAIRFVDGQTSRMVKFTMNGGEMNNNYSAGNGGAIWSGNNLVAYFNGGEVAHNKAAVGGGAVWGGNKDTYYISGDFEMHHNIAGELGNAFRLCHTNWIPVEFEMTGGHIYANDAESGGCAIYANNNPVFLLGGVIDDVVSYNGNDYITVGNTEIKGILEFNHDGRADYKILLDKEFKGINFVVEENDPMFVEFMLDPADGYTYTEGDEAKLVCLNEGYETYWDAATGTFRLQATTTNE